MKTGPQEFVRILEISLKVIKSGFVITAQYLQKCAENIVAMRNYTGT